MEKFKVLTNEKNWIESIAIEQLRRVSELPGVKKAVGLPDLHAGKIPVGISVITEDVIYPYLIGGDIGCGMGLFDTGIELKKLKIKKWENRLNYIRELGDIPSHNPYEEQSPIYDLGTIGGGNHFVEFQKVEEIFLQDEFQSFLNREKIDKNLANHVLVLIHSGSRSYGQMILNQYKSENGYPADGLEAADYLRLHDDAVLWAKRNRKVVANKMISWLGYSSHATKIIDCTHNFLEQQSNGTFIHRKGATSGTDDYVVIPGSRGTFTYIVKPVLENISESAFSLSHGAGRKWSRSLCKSRLRDKYDRDSIRETKLNSKVICHDTELLFQEAPEAYKNINEVINVLIEHKLIEVVATLRPLITYKG